MTDDGERERERAFDYQRLVERERQAERRGKMAGWVVFAVVVGFTVFVILKGISGLRLPSPD